MNLSPNFTLQQLTKSDYGSRHNVKEQFAPPEPIIKKLTALCIHLLEPLLSVIKAKHPNAVFKQTNGYRCPIVNKAAGGAESSQHLFGEASDNELYIDGKEDNLEMAKLLLQNNIDFDQMIIEYGTLQKPDWIHLSWDLDKATQRKMILRADYDKEGNKRTYQMTANAVLAIK